MSYDIYLKGQPEKCHTCGLCAADPDLPNPTYNLTPIFDLALTGEPMPNPEVGEGEVVLFDKPTDRPRGLRLLSGKKATDTVATLRLALMRLEDPVRRKEFVALQPSNGWGTLEDAIFVIEKLLAAAVEYPNHVWEIH